MSATVTTGKLAAAFRTAAGKVVYALFEKTYEKNVYPHTPRWSCIALGYFEQVLKYVFQRGAGCEGDSLQGIHGWIKPENYIADWRRKLAEPVELQDAAIALKVGDSFYSTVKANKEADVRRVLASIGREDISRRLFDAKEEVLLLLHADIDVIHALYGKGGGVLYPWLVLNESHAGTIGRSELGFTPSNKPIEVPNVSVYRFGDNHCLAKFGAGQWGMKSGQHSVVEEYIEEAVFHLELQKTKCATALIAAFREKCQAAPQIPGNARFTVTRNIPNAQKWHQENADELARVLGLVQEGEMAPDRFEGTVNDIMSKNTGHNDTYRYGYLLTYLGDGMVEWDVPEQEVVCASDSMQMELLS